MFTPADMRALLQARPFVPFRLWLSDGGSVEVRSPEVVMVGKRFALFGLLDADAGDTAFDRYATVWHLHVEKTECVRSSRPGPTIPG